MRKLACLVLLAACAGDGGTQIRMNANDRAPAYGETPFPTDAVREGDRIGMIAGLDALVGNHAEIVAAQVAALDGFGLRPLVEFPLDGKLDPASIPARAEWLIDVDPASPERGRAIAVDVRYDGECDVIALSTVSGVVLREGTRYAAYIPTEIRDAKGDALSRGSFGKLADLDRWRTTHDALAELPRDIAG